MEEWLGFRKGWGCRHGWRGGASQGVDSTAPTGSRREAGPRPSSPSGGHLGHSSPPRPPGLLLMGDGALGGLTGLPGPRGHAPISQTAGGGRGAGGELGSGPESQSRPKAWASRLPLLAQERSGSGEEVNMPPLMGREREQVGQPAGQTRLLPRPPGHLLSPCGPLATLRVPLGLPGPLQGPPACPAPA